MTNQHPEWEKESSLTSPSDRNLEVKWRPEQGAPSLTDKEVVEAMKDLNNTNFVKKFPSVDRTYADPPIPMQNIALFSFTPAKGAIPNENGVFGFGKVRGSYSTPVEADQRAEFLIRNVDSYHQLYHLYVGRPFPITSSSKYSAETSEIDIRKETTKAISENIKEEKFKEQQTVKEMKEREEAMLAESEKAKRDDGTSIPDVDPYEEYITLSVKKAQLSWTFLEHLKKLEEVRGIIINTRKTLSKIDSEYPDFKGKYFEKYMEARKRSGLDEKVRDVQDNFMKYMVEDIPIPTIDTDEILPQAAPTKNPDISTQPQDSTLIASQDSPLIVPQDSTLIAPQDSTLIASQDSTLITPEDSTLIASQDSTLITPQDSTLITPQDSTLITPQDSTLIAIEEHKMKLSMYDAKIKDIQHQMHSGDSKLVKEYSNRLIDIIKQKNEWLQNNPRPSSLPLIAPQDSTLIASQDSTLITPQDSTLNAPQDSPLIAAQDSTLIAS